jgi:predicted transposase/invertase (TIGR01784 family)
MKKEKAKELENIPAPSVYMNPLTDFGFKKIFGDRELLIDFLNSMLPEANIRDIRYSPTEQVEWEERKAVYDLLCINEQGEYFLVEVQRVRQTYFADRALFYASCLIRKQAPVGRWNYQLKAVYVISLLNFALAETDEVEDKHIFERVSLMNERTKSRFSDKLQFIYIQLKYFDRKIDELQTNADNWLFLLKNLEKLESQPSKVHGRIFERLFHIARIDKLSKRDMRTYNKSVLQYSDVQDAVQYAETRAKEQGIKIGETRGEKRGIKIGETRGASHTKISFAVKLADKGMSLVEISDLTELSLDELNRIMKK